MEVVQEKTFRMKNPIKQPEDGLNLYSKVELCPFYGVKKNIFLRHQSYTFGSSPQCDIKLDDPFVSQTHAKITLGKNNIYTVEDMGSRNGLYLNGTRLQKAYLPKSGVLRFGQSYLEWQEERKKIMNFPQGILTSSPKMKSLLMEIKQASLSQMPILLFGETGTGKELVARAIHQWSGRKKFVALNCAGLDNSLVDSELFGHRKGAFTSSEKNRLGAILSAHRGSLFLDELEELPPSIQAKLLRVLEGGEVRALGSDSPQISDFRLITATNRPLEEAIEKKRFRLDLYYRVAGFCFTIPPLRERKEDIELIAQSLLMDQGMQLSEQCLEKLKEHSWPGNVRELKLTINRAISSAKLFQAKIIESQWIKIHNFSYNENNCHEKKNLQEVEREHIHKSLIQFNWRYKAVASELGIARSTLFEKIKKYNLNKE